jgi:hypothetical protein
MTGSWNELMLHFRLLSEHVMIGSQNELMHHFRLLRLLGVFPVKVVTFAHFARQTWLVMLRLFC